MSLLETERVTTVILDIYMYLINIILVRLQTITFDAQLINATNIHFHPTAFSSRPYGLRDVQIQDQMGLHVVK